VQVMIENRGADAGASADMVMMKVDQVGVDKV